MDPSQAKHRPSALQPKKGRAGGRKLSIVLGGVCAIGLTSWIAFQFSRGTTADPQADPQAAPPAALAPKPPASGAGNTVVKTTSVAEARSTELANPLEEIDPSEAMLSMEKQQGIWDAEHATHLLEWRFGKPFVKSLRSLEKQQLGKHFRAGFTGSVLRWENFAYVAKGPVTQHRTDSTTASDPADAAVLVDWLAKLRSVVKRVDDAGLRVLAIQALDAEANAWASELLLTIRGRAKDGRLVALDSLHTVDFQWDQEQDIGEQAIISRWQTQSWTVSRCRERLMQEVTQLAGLDLLPIQDNWKLSQGLPRKQRFQLAVEDYDRDGYLDIAVATAEGRAMLLRSQQGRHFTDVTRACGIQPDTRGRFRNFSAAWVDFDNDDYPDLLIGGKLYHNLRGHGFADMTAHSGLSFHPHLMGFTIADYDVDGLLDIYAMYSKSVDGKQRSTPGWVGDDGSGRENQLWHNEGGGRFVDVTAASGTGGGRRHTFASAWLFADEDRYPDLYVANDFGTNLLLRNRGDGTFEDISQESGTADYATSMGVATGDLNNDGRSEIYVANMYSKMGRRIIAQVGPEDYPPGIFPQIQGACTGNRLYSAPPGSLRYEEFGQQLGINTVGWAFAPAMVDLDGDGWLDIHATTGFLSFTRGKPDG